ncbi:transcription factor Adf-1-like [Zerene cesonia]|uniref:transcription factor Adf-1-like n=1 Tax=Zerene cesonia TaxID=33412 RepID=UPI0018E549F9|nr:transcription factor Adf-1-like [Zerene cesonia]
MSMPKCKKILEDIHPLNVIKEVQKWPVLYQKDNPERLNFHFKTKIWYEVAKNLIPEWEQLSDSEKEIKVSDLNKKWRNLRDTFRRQVELEKKMREGYPIKKKRYVYFKHMLFLLPHVAPTEVEEEVEPKLNEYLNTRKEKKSPKKPKRKLQDTIPTSSKKDIDEDKHFLMSLIPSFKKMSDDEKLTAKVEILKVIQQVRSQSIEFTNTDIAFVEEPARGIREVKVEMVQEGEELESDNSGDSDDSSDFI